MTYKHMILKQLGNMPALELRSLLQRYSTLSGIQTRYVSAHGTMDHWMKGSPLYLDINGNEYRVCDGSIYVCLSNNIGSYHRILGVDERTW